eukprot:scaffold182855_cov46-Attheya_sp.AAC.3
MNRVGTRDAAQFYDRVARYRNWTESQANILDNVNQSDTNANQRQARGGGYMPTTVPDSWWLDQPGPIHSQSTWSIPAVMTLPVLPQTVGYLKKSQNHQMWVMCGGQGHPN